MPTPGGSLLRAQATRSASGRTSGRAAPPSPARRGAAWSDSSRAPPSTSPSTRRGGGASCLRGARLGGRPPAAGGPPPRPLHATPSGDGEASAASDGTPSPTTTTTPFALPVRLNSTPTPRPVRNFFYADAAEGVCAALAAGEKRLAVKITLPETDRTFDSYRLATILECVRESVMRLADAGKTIRVCVQGPLGEGFFTGMPLSLAGAGKMIAQMDWGRTAAQEAAVSFGDVSAAAVEGGVDVFFIIAPQNMAGACVTAPLETMAEAAAATGAAMVLINPSLADVQSSGGLMSVRGRGDRLAFEASFVPAYVFRLLFTNPSIPYPILGALRYSYGQAWQVWSREEAAAHVEGREVYFLAGETGNEAPTPTELTSILRTRRAAVERMEREAREASRRLAEREGRVEKRGWWQFW